MKQISLSLVIMGDWQGNNSWISRLTIKSEDPINVTIIGTKSIQTSLNLASRRLDISTL